MTRIDGVHLDPERYPTLNSYFRDDYDSALDVVNDDPATLDHIELCLTTIETAFIALHALVDSPHLASIDDNARDLALDDYAYTSRTSLINTTSPHARFLIVPANVVTIYDDAS